LPPRSGDETLSGERLSLGRRPADVWFPAGPGGPGGGPHAIDVAVSSGLKVDAILRSAIDPASVWGHYEDFKRHHASTEAQRRAQGLTFLLFVVEAHGGGLGPIARRVCAIVAKAAGAKDGDEVDVQAAGLLRRISTSLQRENARAVLRRLATTSVPEPSPNPAAWAEPALVEAWQ